MKQPKIGFLLLQDEINGRCGWIAGLHFIKNCLHAIACLPKDTIPPIIIFIPDDLVDEDIESHHWLSIVKIPVAQLNNPHEHHIIENTINGYQCDLYFPLLTMPQLILKGKWIGWIPDFQDHHLPHLFKSEDLFLRQCVNGFISAYCHKVVCISKSVSEDFKTLYPAHKNKTWIINTRAHINQALLRISPYSALGKYDLLGKKYIYMPNQFWTHKNHKTVLAAWSQIIQKNKDCLLVCTGATHDYRAPTYYEELLADIAKYNLQEHIKLLGYINRNDQIQLFRGARAILQPSLFEGWNISLEEAKLLGKFIFASNIPVQLEQCSSQAVFFNPHDATDLANVILAHWHELPVGYDSVVEKQAYQDYQTLMLQCGNELLNLFNHVYQHKNQLSIDNFIKLPVYLSRELQKRHATCHERLELIEDLHGNLQKSQEIMIGIQPHLNLIEPPTLFETMLSWLRYQRQSLRHMLHFLFRKMRKSM